MCAKCEWKNRFQSSRCLAPKAVHKFLPQVEITSVGFVDLDTQGAELDILQGADCFLRSSVVVLRLGSGKRTLLR